MSFTSEIKNELARLTPSKKCCMLAEIAGFMRICGSIGLAGGGKFKIVMSTDNPAVARHFKLLIKSYFNVDASLEVSEATTLNRSKNYLITIKPEDRSEEILRETGILMIKEGMNFISDGIYSQLIRRKCCKKSYLTGLFIGCGVITDPEKKYHFEISSRTKILAEDIVKLLNSFKDINAKMIKRRKEYVVYIKNSEEISDILAMMKANNQLFAFEDARIRKDIKNRANRINNCDQANIDKTIKAAERHISNIRKIEEKVGLHKLPEKLRQVAKARLENPDATLVELGEMLEPPLKKSGINKRLLKIEEFAEKI